MNFFRSLSALFLDIVETVVVALSIFLVIYLFFMQPHQVSGKSMEPNFHDKEYLLTDKVSYQTGEPQRGDIVVFHAPESSGCPEGTGCDFIKRVLAVPGETVAVKDGGLVVNGQTVTEPYIAPENLTQPGAFTEGERVILLGQNEYFVVGDNRMGSSDSRVWGPIGKEEIIGRAFFRYWPLDRMGIIPRTTYDF
jgi:signal peptidase I